MERGFYNFLPRLTFLTLISVFCITSLLSADTVILKGDQKLTGDIITEKNGAVYLDIGLTVLKIPKDQIAELKYDSEEEVQIPDANITDPLEEAKEVKGLYTVTSGRKTSIEKAVEAVSEAVVKVSTPGGSGSGFFFNEAGYLITNFHVIEKETRIEITLFKKTSDGFEKKKFKKVKIEAINPFIDLALLKVEELGDTQVKTVSFGKMEDLNVGEAVFAIGNPLGLERTVTDGLVSSKNRAFEGLVYIQTNTDINPGNSGGPLFNLAGEVVGVTNMGYIFYGGLGFAIPINYVKHFIENRDVFAYDKDNPNSGFRYIQPGPRRNFSEPDFLKKRIRSSAGRKK
jgi:serine protease Do